MSNFIQNTPTVYSRAFSNEEVSEMRIKRLTNELREIIHNISLRAEEYKKQQCPDGGTVDTSV